MGSLASIVNVQISRQTSVPTRAGFGTGAFLADDTTLTNLTKTYTSLADMTGDSELTASEALVAGAAYFGQQLAAPKFTVLREVSTVAQVSTLTFSGDLLAAHATVVTLDGGDLSSVPFDTDNADTLAAIAVVIAAETQITSAVVNGAEDGIIVTAAVVDTAFSISAVVTGDPEVTVLSLISVYAGGISGSLSNASSENNDWYGLAIHSRLVADIEEASDWVQGQGTSNPKLFFAQNASADILNPALSTDICSVLTAKSAFRTAVMYHADDAEYADVAWMGGQLPNDPGSITWAYKSLSLVTVDTFAAGEKAAAHAKNCNTYDTVASVNITEEGKVCDGGSGEFIDTIRGVDWIQVNAQADLYTILVQNPKVPYTTVGISLFKITLTATLSRAQLMGILTSDSDPVITAPLIGDVPAIDKSTRTLNDLDFTGILAGAIQKINVKGTVTL